MWANNQTQWPLYLLLLEGSTSALADENANPEQKFQHNMMAVIAAAHCVKAFLNDLGWITQSNWAEKYWLLNPLEKLNLFISSHGKGANIHAEPFRSIEQIFQIQHEVIMLGGEVLIRNSALEEEKLSYPFTIFHNTIACRALIQKVEPFIRVLLERSDPARLDPYWAWKVEQQGA